MATWSKLFSFFTWKNRPDTSTPLGQTLLNRLNTALNGIDDRVVTLNTQKVSTDEIQGVFTDVRLIKNTGQFVFTLFDGTEKIIDTALEKISINVSFDKETQMMVLEKEDGSKEYVDLSVFTTQYEFVSSPTIQQTVTDGKVRADIKPNSITDQMLQTNYLADIITQANTAVSASQSALESQSLAEQSADDADRHADRAEAAANRAESIVGFTVDTELSTSSTNPIANKAVAEALENVDAKTLNGNAVGYFAKETDLEVERQRINNLATLTEGSTTGDAELADIRVGADGKTYTNAGDAVRGQISDLKSDLSQLENGMVELENICVTKSANLYNPTLQTSNTISPHYYVNGAPYETTQFDNMYNCTALIEIEPDVQYAIGVVPSVGGYTLPWGSASYGLFFYDKDGNYISGSLTTVFITPSNAKYIRFNYNIGYPMNMSLETLNACCMLVKGNALPTSYEPYFLETLKERVEKLENGEIATGINYNIISDGIEIKYNYGNDTMKVILKKKGGNNLFDFESVVKENGGALINGSGDWHSPFIMKAVNNADGDNIVSGYFTGGNHQSNNQATGGAKTARTTSVRYFVDGKEVASGSGSARTIEIRWTNLVQGYNTSKSDGTGREILQENHTVFFRDGKFFTHIELIPLEDVVMERWYGLQGITTPYPNFKYVGGTNRGVYTGTSYSGNLDAYEIICFGNNDKMTISIDNTYDLGKRSAEMVSGASGIFTQDYGKCYFYIINKEVEMAEGNHYFLRGTYEFSPM